MILEPAECIVAEVWSVCTLCLVVWVSPEYRFQVLLCLLDGTYVCDGYSLSACTCPVAVCHEEAAGRGGREIATFVGMCQVVPSDLPAVIGVYGHPVYKVPGLLSFRVSMRPDSALFVLASLVC